MVHLLHLVLVTGEVVGIAEVEVVVIVVGAMRVVDMMVAVGAVVVVALMVVTINIEIGIMVLMVRVLHLLPWHLFHLMMVLGVTLHHLPGMVWKQFPLLQAMLVDPHHMVVPQGVMVVEVVATMVVALLEARKLVMEEMQPLKKSSSVMKIVMRLVIMPEYTSLIYPRM